MKTFSEMYEERAKELADDTAQWDKPAPISAFLAIAKSQLILSYAAQNARAVEALIEGRAAVIPIGDKNNLDTQLYEEDGKLWYELDYGVVSFERLDGGKHDG